MNLSTANHEWLGEGFKSFEEAEDSIRYDSVRGAFYEGDVAYKGTEIRKKIIFRFASVIWVALRDFSYPVARLETNFFARKPW